MMTRGKNSLGRKSLARKKIKLMTRMSNSLGMAVLGEKVMVMMRKSKRNRKNSLVRKKIKLMTRRRNSLRMTVPREKVMVMSNSLVMTSLKRVTVRLPASLLLQKRICQWCHVQVQVLNPLNWRRILYLLQVTIVTFLF